jgi:hypothetical protein
VVDSKKKLVEFAQVPSDPVKEICEGLEAEPMPTEGMGINSGKNQRFVVGERMGELW